MDSYVGDIRIFAGSFAPQGWMLCDGQLLPLGSDYDSLYQLIGTTYGGDGVSNFRLPDLRGRLPIHQGNGFVQGQTGGSYEATLSAQHLPYHSHGMPATSERATPAGGLNATGALANTGGTPMYASANPAATVPLSSDAISATGSSLPHTNVQPYLCINFIISLGGYYPSQS